MSVRILLCLALSSFMGCAGHSPAPIEDRGYGQPQPRHSAYTVKRGDTLYSIAFRYGMDFRKVAAANGIGAPYTIYPGQQIRLDQTPQAPSAAPAGTLPATRPPVAVAGAAPAPNPAASSGATHYPVQSTPPAKTLPPPAAPITASASTLPQSPGAAATSGRLPADVPPPTALPPASDASTQPAVAGPQTAPIVSAPPPAAPPVATAPAIPQKPAAPAFAGEEIAVWRWPASGPVIRGYSESVHKGIDIGGARGDPVTAVAAGKVVYAGTGIAGFGELLIIKHNDVYLSAYGHNDELLVKEGDSVAAGQLIAQKGSSGTDSVKLHFEIRQAGKPVDPQRLLPGR